MDNLKSSVSVLCASCLLLFRISHATPAAGIEEEIISTPHIWSSVDQYKTVCDNEVIYLTCSASNCWSVTWTSSAYVGTRTAIEFNQDHDRPGDGKLVSLPGGRSTLAQISKTESSLSSDLKIRVPNNVHRTNVICTNDLLEYDTKFFVLANEAPSPPQNLLFEDVAENPTSGVVVYKYTWDLPENIDSIDLDSYQLQIDDQLPLNLTNSSREFVVAMEYGHHNVSITAVDRCGQRSQTVVFEQGNYILMSGQTQQGVETNLYHKESLYDINSSSTNIYGSFILLFIALLVLLYVCDC